MAEHCNHTIHKHHLGWNNANEPALSIASGETIEFRTIDSSGRQITPKSTVADIPKLDFAKVNPVSGPIYIDDAQPGDAVKVTLLDFTPSGWGWTANIPGFGLLADQFKEPALHIWSYDTQRMAPAAYGPGGRVPLKPFCGTIGLAPAEAGTDGTRIGSDIDGTRIGSEPTGVESEFTGVDLAPVEAWTDGTRIGSDIDGTRIGSDIDGTRIGSEPIAQTTGTRIGQ